MKIAVNFHHKNKMPQLQGQDEIRKWWRWFNGSFQNITIDKKDLPVVIRAGRAYTTCHKNYRKADNFLLGQHLGLDMDTKDFRSSFDFLLQDDFIAQNALLLHTTASHTPDKPKSRVLFMLEYPIGNAERYADYASALVWKFNSADKHCRDAARLFFGAEDCDIHYLGNVLTHEVVEKELLAPYQQYLEEEYARKKRAIDKGSIIKPDSVSDNSLNSLWESLLEHVLFAPDGEKYHTLLKIGRAFGGYVAGGYISQFEAESLLESAVSQRQVDSMAVARSGITSAVEYGMRDPLYVKQYEEDFVLDLGVPIKKPKHMTVGNGVVEEWDKILLATHAV